MAMASSTAPQLHSSTVKIPRTGKRKIFRNFGFVTLVKKLPEFEKTQFKLAWRFLVLMIFLFTKGYGMQFDMVNVHCLYSLSSEARDLSAGFLTDCSFLVTQATVNSDGSYEICVQANDLNAAQQWTIAQDGGVTVSFSDPIACQTFPPGSSLFNIDHEVNGVNCYLIFHIYPDSSRCQDSVVTVSNVKCDLLTTLDIDIGALETPYVITFGDGSLAVQSSDPQVQHTYQNEGTYEVCITYMFGEAYMVTCCYTVEVTLKPECICPTGEIEIVDVEPCEWIVTLDFGFDPSYFPVEVDFGDGSPPEIITQSQVSHDYPSPGNYQVCYTYEVFPQDSITCCEWIESVPGSTQQCWSANTGRLCGATLIV